VAGRAIRCPSGPGWRTTTTSEQAASADIEAGPSCLQRRPPGSASRRRGSTLVLFSALLPHALDALHALLLVFGADFIGRNLDVGAVLAMVHLVGLGLAAWAACLAVRRFFGDLDLVTGDGSSSLAGVRGRASQVSAHRLGGRVPRRADRPIHTSQLTQPASW